MTARRLAKWDVSARAVGARNQPVPLQDGFERSRCRAVEGTGQGSGAASPTQRPGEKRRVMAQRARIAVRRANAGQPPDREAMLHVDDHDDSPSRREGRAPERRAEGTPCIDQAGSVAATRDIRVPAMSTRTWHNSRLTGLTLPSRFSSDGHRSRDAHRHHRRRVSPDPPKESTRAAVVGCSAVAGTMGFVKSRHSHREQSR